MYKKDADGNWSSNTGSGWKPAEQPTRPAGAGTQSATQTQRPTTKPQTTKPQATKPQTTKPQTTKPQTTGGQSLDSMARSRERGSTQTQRAQSFQRSAPSGGARSGGGGGGGGRRR